MTFRNLAFNDSIAFVELSRFRTSMSRSRKGTKLSHAARHSLPIAGYLADHFSSKDSNAASAASTFTAVYTGFRSRAISGQYFLDEYLNVFLIRWTTQVCTIVSVNTMFTLSGIPFNPSHTR